VKRLTFKREFVEDVHSGKKRFTSRWQGLGLHAGDVVAAVCRNGNRPAFLVPASEAFAILRIESAELIPWGEFTEDHAAKCGVTRDWYLKENPGATANDCIFMYGFRREEAAAVPTVGTGGAE
jgi:hypothetical protein